MPKRLCHFRLQDSVTLPSGCVMMRFAAPDSTLACVPGQFVEVKVDGAPSAMLRRPISICDFSADGILTLMVKPVGEGTRVLTSLAPGADVDMLLPLGHGFTTDDASGRRVLLVGGGVGIAPLVFLCRVLSAAGAEVHLALGGRSAADLKGLEMYFPSAAAIECSTDDGSLGTHGVVTATPAFSRITDFDRVYCCGPTPMMKAVARIARQNSVWAEVSLENHMACGLGACLCCVENLSEKEGNVCVCTEGPVFNVNRLESWQ